MNSPKILVVDDEKMILGVMERVLNSSMPCEVTTASDGVEALKIMESQKFDMIISDMSMPGMDGADLLKTVHELHPDTVRLMFSARAGGESVLKAVGITHQYFLKPMSVDILSDRISSMLHFKEMLPTEGVENIVSGTGSLPSIPEVYQELEMELKKRDMSIERVGSILEKDVAMSAKILQLVNSAFFGLRENVTKPQQAVTLLGLNTVKSLFLGLHVFEGWKTAPVSGFSPHELWKHSVQVASGAMDIALSMGMNKEDAGEVYCAGLFHDIGKLVISANLPESLAQVVRLNATGILWPEAEREILGASHAEIGAYLMSLWGFRPDVVKGVAFHHLPARSGEKGFSSVLAVHVANYFSHDEAKRNDRVVLDMDYIKELELEAKLREWKASLHS